MTKKERIKILDKLIKEAKNMKDVDEVDRQEVIFFLEQERDGLTEYLKFEDKK